MANVLIDTNVLVYPFDPRDPVKGAQAEAALVALREKRTGYLSVQSLAEFMNATRKLSIPTDLAREYVEDYIHAFVVFDLTPQIVLEAARGVRDHQLAYYDAQIWATARLNQIPILFSEDFRDGVSLEGVRFVNPFAPAFALDDWA